MVIPKAYILNRQYAFCHDTNMKCTVHDECVTHRVTVLDPTNCHIINSITSNKGVVLAEVPQCCANYQDIIGLPKQYKPTKNTGRIVMPIDAASVSILLRNPDVKVYHDEVANTFHTTLSGFGYPSEQTVSNNINVQCKKRRMNHNYRYAHEVLLTTPHLPINEDERAQLQQHLKEEKHARMEQRKAMQQRRRVARRLKSITDAVERKNATPNDIPFVTEIILPHATKQ